MKLFFLFLLVFTQLSFAGVGSTSVVHKIDVIEGVRSQQNIIKNGSAELGIGAGVLAWTNSAGVLTQDTSNYVDGSSAFKIALTAQTLSFSQSSTYNASNLSGRNGLVSAFIKHDCTSVTVSLCSLVNGSEDTCTAVNANVGFQQIQIPTVMGSTSTGIKAKTSGSATCNIYVDNAFVGVQQLGTMSSCSSPIACATSFTAAISSIGTVSNESLDFINGNCSVASTNQFTCTLNSLGISNPLRCVGNAALGNNGVFQTDYSGSPSTSNFVYRTQRIDNVAEAENVNVTCFKTGSDYTSAITLTPSINSINADYDWTVYTPTFTGFGTVSSSSCFHKRQGSDLLIRCKWTNGTRTATEARISFPSGLTSLSSIATLELAGRFVYGGGAVSTTYEVLAEPSVSYMTFAYAGNNGLVKVNGSAFLGDGSTQSLYARFPIQGWANNNVIVGTFTKNIDSIDLKGYNGYGSTNTKIIRFDGVRRSSTNFNIFTYADSATLGNSITFNRSAYINASFCQKGATNDSTSIGLSLNSNQLTTNIESITDSNILNVNGSVADGTTRMGVCSVWSGPVSANDVLRIHTNGVAAFDDINTNFSMMAEY